MAQARSMDTALEAAERHVSDKAAEFASKAGKKVGEALDSAEDVAGRITAQGREAGERVQAVASNVKTAIDKSIDEQPLTTLAVALALGFVVGALWKS